MDVVTPPRAATGADATGEIPVQQAPDAGLRLAGVMPRVLLGDRYRLIRPVDALLGSTGPEAESTVLWRAEDEVLARPVAVRVLVLRPGDARLAVLRRQFLDAAVAAGRLAHPCLARVYDASDEVTLLDDGSNGDVAYVVSEWVEGRTLTTALRDGPLSAARAVAVLREASDGVMAAHDAGIVHGRLHPGNVMISTNGQVKVTDTAVAAALAGISSGSQGTRPDVRDLGRVLYAALTAKWPGDPAVDRNGATWKGLPEAPRTNGRACAPRQVTAGVPKNLDQVVTRTIDPERAGTSALTTVRAFAAALPEAESLVPNEKPTRKERREEAGRGRIPWWGWSTAALLVIALVSGTGYILGAKIGTFKDTSTDQKLASINAGSSGTTAKTADGPGSQIILTASELAAFDPPPGDGSENDSQLQNVIDGDVETPWNTETYATNKFGGLKQGVGFIVDLGSAQTVGTVSIALEGGVTGIQLRVADTPTTTLDGFKVVGEADDADQTVTLKSDGAAHRYYLVWLTSLPAAPKGGGYRAAIDEVVFKR